jgi:hypothetical protein
MKLVKRENDYCLYNELGETIAASWANVTGKKLLQSNCDEIFGVVDVEKLAKEVLPNDDTTSRLSQQKGFVIGFNKAMEEQQRMYSEEEVIELLTARCKHFGTTMTPFRELLLKQDLEWFEQFKKK